MRENIKLLFIFLGSLFLSSCNNDSEQLTFLAKAVLKIEELPKNSVLVDEYSPFFPFNKTKEYYLEILPSDYDLLISGRNYDNCHIQEVLLHDAFLSFPQMGNIQLKECVKTKGIAIYSNEGRTKLFILFDY
ncbi:hypothetical protein [Pleionea sp. CnH1-48]|uniref:hypothetical protein n=1 Tax=Pleionea sp. CnH1-48 TaxID=2954494 RepID=UPI002097BA1E|nr:hypothetical protein [Pleionea sp. CnH1-48]MCO7226958.1 hypothetical protein [Pleionea sp. CnH1-48]